MDFESGGGFSADCMMLLHMTFAQAVAAFGWHELYTFAQHLPDECATRRALDEDGYRFTHLQQAAMLADIYDAVSAFTYLFAKAHGSKGAAPKPYPRPWDTGKGQKIGSGAIPISEFEKWYYGGD